MKKLLHSLSIVFILLCGNSYSQDAAYTMTATTKTITSCRSSLYADLSCIGAGGKAVFCSGTDRAYTFLSNSGGVINVNLMKHYLGTNNIYVYDGPNSASPLLATWTGGTAANFQIGLNALSTGTAVTIRFVSTSAGAVLSLGGGNAYSGGWELLIGCAPSSCNGNLPASDICTTAPQICNLNGYCGNTSGWYNEDNPQLEFQPAPGFPGSIENNSWISFVAAATTATLTVNSANCFSLTRGIQGAVYASTNCSTFTPINGGNFNQINGPGNVTLSLTGLVTGQNYYLMLDGYLGNICDYTVTASGNVQTLNSTSSSSSNTICPNQSFTVTATAGATSYSWSPAPASTSSNTAVYNNISSTAVISTTAFGYCGASATVALTMSVVALPISVTSATLCSGTSTVLTASGASTYTWAPGTSLSATTGATVTANPTTTTIVYTVTGTSGVCTASNTCTVTVNATPTVAVTNTTICNGSTVTLTASGAITYAWNTGAVTASVSVSPTTTTVYTVTGTSSGCSATQVATITVNATPTITANSPTICSGTSTVLTAGTATSYLWSTGATTSTISVTPTVTTSYTVTGTSNGCSATQVATVTVNATPTITVNSPTICSGTSTVLTAGTATSYLWSTGATTSTISVTPTVTTSYTVTGTSSGCSATQVATVTVNATPTITVNSPTICSGTSTVLTAGTATSYLWSTGATTSTISVTPTVTTSYTVTVTSSGCSSVKVATVTVNPIPTTTATASGPINCSTPTITLNSTLASVSYTWTAPSGGILGTANSQNTSASGAGGIYTLNVQSAGCTFSTTVSVTQNTVAPTGFSAGSNQTLTCGSPSVNLTGSVGTPANATLNWTGANVCGTATTIATSACGAGVYTLTATDPTNGCIQTPTVNVFASVGSPSVTANAPSNSITCTNTLVTVSVSTTVTPVAYTWSGTGISSGNGTGTITVTQGGTFIYSVTAGGCTTSGNIFVVTNTTVPTTTASTSGVVTCSTNTVTLNSTLPSMNYTWTAPSGASVSTASTQSTIGTGIGDYSLTVINPANGCTFSTTTTVIQNITPPTLTLSPMSPTLSCVTNTVQLIATTIDTDVAYSWTTNGSLSSTTISNPIATGSGTYNIIVTNTITGCQANATATVITNTTPPTLTVSPLSFTLGCVTNTVQLVATTTNTAVSYAWTTNGSVSSNIVSNPIATGSGTYNIIVTNTITGCQANATATVTSNTTPPTLTLSPMSPTLSCVTNTVQLIATTIDTDVAYSWTTNGSLSSNTISSPIATGSGTYNIIVTNTITGCQANATATVTANTTPPTLTLSPLSFTLGCVTNTVQLVATTTNTAVSYAWTTNGSLGSTTISNPIATGSGTYNVIVTNTITGCQANATATVTTNTTPPTLTVSPLSFTLGCVTNTVQLVATTTNTAVSYAWTTNGSLGSTTISNPIATGSGTYNVIVTNTITGCQANATATVTTITTPPTLTVSPLSFTLGCVTNTVQLVATTTNTAVSYAWTTNGSLSSTTISNPIATGSGTYNVIVTNTITGCQANATATVTTNTTPPTLTLSPMSFTLTCASPTVQLIATTTNTAVSYTWTTNGSLNNSAISNPIATGSGTYNVIVTNTLTGCQANASANLSSNTTPPTITVSNTVIPCGSPSVAIGAIVTPTNVTYNWTTSGTGSILSVANMSTAVAGSAGQYIVTVSDNTNGCTKTGTVAVISTGITAAFTANPLSGTAPLLVNFTNQSTGASIYSWTFSDNTNNTSTSTNPSHTFNTTGNYIVTLTATDASSLCIATATISIEVLENSSIIIPNVFTPNADGSNDLFKITTTGMKDLTCDIFNRWGTKLYTIKSVTDSWDGSGSADGTYFFILQAKGFDDKEFKQQGYISLFR